MVTATRTSPIWFDAAPEYVPFKYLLVVFTAGLLGVGAFLLDVEAGLLEVVDAGFEVGDEEVVFELALDLLSFVLRDDGCLL